MSGCQRAGYLNSIRVGGIVHSLTDPVVFASEPVTCGSLKYKQNETAASGHACVLSSREGELKVSSYVRLSVYSVLAIKWF